MDVTSQPRATANLQIRDPRKPFPPQMTTFLTELEVDAVDIFGSISDIRKLSLGFYF